MKSNKKAALYPYKNKNLTINQFVDLPECRFKYAAVRARLIAGICMDKIALDKDTRRRGVAQKHNFLGVKLSVKEFLAAVKVELTEARVRYRLAQGQTLEEIANGKKLPVAEKIKEDAPIYSSASSIKFPPYSTAQAKKIMAVPQDPKTQQEYYMRKTYIGTPDTEPTKLSGRNWMGRV